MERYEDVLTMHLEKARKYEKLRMERYRKSVILQRILIILDFVPIIFFFTGYEKLDGAKEYIRVANVLWTVVTFPLFFLSAIIVEMFKGKSTELIQIQRELEEKIKHIEKFKGLEECNFLKMYIDEKIGEIGDMKKRIFRAAYSCENEDFLEVLANTLDKVLMIKLRTESEPLSETRSLPPNFRPIVERYCQVSSEILKTKRSDRNKFRIVKIIFIAINVVTSSILGISIFRTIEYTSICNLYNVVISPIIGFLIGKWSRTIFSNTSTIEITNHLIEQIIERVDKMPECCWKTRTFQRIMESETKIIEDVIREIISIPNTSSMSEELLEILRDQKNKDDFEDFEEREFASGDYTMRIKMESGDYTTGNDFGK